MLIASSSRPDMVVDSGFTALGDRRASQLDGMRAFAMLAICWDHWRPEGWARVFPFEVFLFFFLVMTGYLITGSLLREKERGEAKGGAWRMKALWAYQIRRGLRILAPYYVALVLAFLVLAPDVWQAPAWYIFHLSNIHMAFLDNWPPGTNHFWSLAMQQQFYLIWPFVIWWVPRRWLVFVIILFAIIGPISRLFHAELAVWCQRPEVLTVACFDYFGIGGLFALAVHRGMSLESLGLRWLAGIAFMGYVGIFGANAAGCPTFGLRPLQQTLLSISLCGFIAAVSVGFSGGIGHFLERPWLQRIGELSYGIYLFHNIAPLLAGKLCWFLWDDLFQNDWGALLRVVIFVIITWGLTLLTWHCVEVPLQEVRSRFTRR